MSRANPYTTHDNAGIAAWNFKLEADISSYDDCATFLGGARERKIGPKMVVREYSTILSWRCYIAIVLYDTEIIRYYSDGTFSVDNGGFNTLTTSHRLTAVLPDGFSAYHHQKQLGLNGPSGGWNHGHLWPLDHDKRITMAGELVEM